MADELTKAQEQVSELSQLQVPELSQLPADTNGAVEKARSAALTAGEELEQKERQLEVTQAQLSELQTKSAELERALKTATSSQGADELMRGTTDCPS